MERGQPLDSRSRKTHFLETVGITFSLVFLWYLPLGNATAPCVIEPGTSAAVERPGVVGASAAAAPAAVVVAAVVAAVVVAVAVADAAIAVTDVASPGAVESGVAGAEGRADGIAARGLAVP